MAGRHPRRARLRRRGSRRDEPSPRSAGLVHANGHRALRDVSLALERRRARRGDRPVGRRQDHARPRPRHVAEAERGPPASSTTTIRGGSAPARCGACARASASSTRARRSRGRLRVVTAVLAGRLGTLAGVEVDRLARRPGRRRPARARRSTGSTSATASSIAATGSRAASCSASASPASSTSSRQFILADEPVSALDPRSPISASARSSPRARRAARPWSLRCTPSTSRSSGSRA